MSPSKRHRSPLIWLCAAVLALAGSIANAQDSLWEISPEPKWGSQAVYESDKPNGGKGGIYYQIYEKHHRYTADNFSNYLRYVYVITNSNGLEDNAQLSIDIDPIYQTVKLHKVLVHRKNRQIDQLDAGNIELLQRESEMDDGLYNGDKTVHLLLKDLRVGDRVEVSYTVDGMNPVFDNHVFGWAALQSGVPVGVYRFQLRHPREKQVSHKIYAGDVQSESHTEGGYTESTWQVRNAKGKRRQSNVPSSHISQTLLQYSDFATWAAVEEWANPLYQLESQNPDGIKEYVSDIKANYQSTEMQIAKVVEFVQDEVRYTGINNGVGGFKPDAPDIIFKRRFGDCKDKSVLMIALLRELGVDAYPALVHSRDGKALPEFLPAPSVFNHVIVHIPNLNEKSYWVDGTIAQQGRDLDSKFQVTYHNALVVGKASDGLTNYKYPRAKQPEKEIVETYSFKYNHETDPTLFTVKSIYRGYEAEYMRRSIQENGLSGMQENYLTYYERSLPGIEISEELNVSDDRDNNVLTVVESYTITDAWEERPVEDSTSDTNFNFDTYAESITGDLRMPDDRKRREPLAQIHPVYVKHTIVLEMEGGWNIDAAEQQIRNRYFKYKASESVTGNKLKLVYQLKTLNDTVSVEDSRNYLKDLEEMLDNPYYSVYHNYNPDSSASPEKPDDSSDTDSLFSKLSQWLAQ